MNDIAIRVKGLGKLYRIGAKAERYQSLRDALVDALKAPFRRKEAVPTLWALKDVSFAVNHGEVLGIIGRNGAGKSTLLKILSRITDPTEGCAEIHGRVGSLLEIGTGFHPELTGRENIFLNGAILGMKKRDIERQFDAIVDFSEIGQFLDTPVKHYSSGMFMRLAFSVAAHLESDILMVDEVLAVGDAKFQKKCMGKMGDVAAKGRTVLFVSHNMAAIQRLCRTGLYLDAGRINYCGSASEAVARYQKAFVSDGAAVPDERSVREGDIRFIRWETIRADPLLPPHSCQSRDQVVFKFTLVSRRRVNEAAVLFAVWSLDGTLLLAAGSRDQGREPFDIQEGTHSVLVRTRLPLKAGLYQLDISLYASGLGQLDRWTAEPRLNVLPRLDTQLAESWHGLLNEEVGIDLVE
ncbi:MAG: ATP-binding cassette domain-containing protein [Lentisphaerae bacterium]|nr:ATP-binding cassette domain-containing protein [Lentisphaerota bacterium]